MIRFFFPAASLAALACFPSMPAAAADFADLSAIDRELAGFAGSVAGGVGSVAGGVGSVAGGVGGVVQPVDRRLRLVPCSLPLALSWRGERRDTVLVQCPDAGGWRLFVPVRGASSPVSGAPAAGVAAVARGEEVTVAITGDGFTVSQSGEALEAGIVGDWIRVSPVKDGKSASEPIRAQVVRPGLVAVLLP
jgi:flagella basal body P-ring formation protein FlgA